MQTAPKSMRLHIALFGRTNVGKSSLLNLVAGQNVAITSAEPGTTTDVVEKPMELLPIGPVVFLDTAGVDDNTSLAEARIAKTRDVLNRAEVVMLVTDPSDPSEHEKAVLEEAASRKLPALVVVNKIDLRQPSDAALEFYRANSTALICCSAIDEDKREQVRGELKAALVELCPEDFLKPPPLLGDLLPAGGLVVMIVPIDLQAPKGRLILPQVQAIRDALDHDAASVVVKEREYAALLQRLTRPPDLVICDSQVVLKMVADTPPGVPCTTFSILYSRWKGDLPTMAKGATMIDRLKSGDRVLIAESCSHHAMEDDIGRVKIPRWIRQYTGVNLDFEHCAGRDFPDNLAEFSLVVQCGGCMNNRREILSRIERAHAAGVPITNYGLCISLTQGVLKRVLSPFPAAQWMAEGAR